MKRSIKLYDGGIGFLIAIALVSWIAYENAKNIKPAVDNYVKTQCETEKQGDGNK